MKITDNIHRSKHEFIEAYPLLSEKILDRTLADLAEKEDILVFPTDLSKIKDLDDDNKIVEGINDSVHFKNIVGFIGQGSDNLVIQSRFSEQNSDYLFNYLLQKVLNINIVDLETGLSFDQYFYQLLIYMFPKYLNSAMRKGLYKEYRKFEYNDSNVRGVLDIARHVRTNIPFRGNIAYSTREFTFDNNLMELVRHTIEFIKLSKNNAKNILRSSKMTQNNVAAIIEATPRYQSNNRRKIINSNKVTPIRHAYYTEYRILQRICLMILMGQKHGLTSNGNKIKGILFDVAWLWEEYVNLLLGDDFKHPQNKSKEDGIFLYSEMYKKHRNLRVYPDFYNATTIIDTKYKQLDSSIKREDRYQIISYLHILNCKNAGFVYPTKDIGGLDRIGDLSGLGGTIFKYGLHIPQEVADFSEFSRKMLKSEQDVMINLVAKLNNTVSHGQ